MNKKEKLKIIKKLDEENFTKRFLIQLFEKMGFKNVVYNHGTLEYGKDIIYCEETKFHKQKYVGVQVKKGDINTTVANKIFCQVAEGLGDPFKDLSNNNKEMQIDEFIVLSSGEIKGNAREKMSKSLKSVHIDKPISFMEGREIIDLLEEYLPSAFWDEYDHFNKYFNAMKLDFKEIKDFSAIGQKEPIPLEDIYVSLKVSKKQKERRILKEEEQKIFVEKLFKEHVEREFKREYVLDAEKAIDDHNKLVILGNPGSGKTTLLKHLALKCCKENLDRQERTMIPIPIIIRKFSDSGKKLRDYIDEIFEFYQFPKAKKFIESDLKKGKCKLFLDGFDELATKDVQEKISKQILEFSDEYPKNQIVATSRIAGYNDELRNFTKLELLDFDDEKIEKFIDNWFGKVDPEKARSMFNAIKENEQIKSLARNPLMISIIAIIYEEDRKLPQKRAALYDRCVQVLLNKWDVQKRLKNKYSSDKKEFFLRKLAFYGHSRNKRIMTEDEIIGELKKYSTQLQLDTKEFNKFLDEIWKRSYLLRQISIDSYDFLHLSFQEYFAALELKENEQGLSIIVEHLSEPWWEEPIRLYAGISKDATALIDKIKNEVPEDIFYNNLILFGKLIIDTEFTKQSLKDEIVNDLWSLYKTTEFDFLKEKTIEVLSTIKPNNIVDQLIKDITSIKYDIRWFASKELGNLGSEKAVESLIKALETDEDRIVRMYAASSLGSLGSEKAVEPLIKAIEIDEDRNVRFYAIAALNGIEHEKTVGPLIKLLDTSENESIRKNAIIGLGIIGSEKAVEPLIKTLETGEDKFLQEIVASALGNIGSKKAVEPLIKTLKTSKDKSVRKVVASALGNIGSKKAVEPLIKTLETDEVSVVRFTAARALGNIGSKNAVDPLIKSLEISNDKFIQWEAAEALGRIGSEKAVDPLIKALETGKYDFVQKYSAKALGIIGSEKTINSLIKALEIGETEFVRKYAALALGNIEREKVIGPLIMAMNADEAESVRWNATRALGIIGCEKALDPLIKALETSEDRFVREDAAEKLGNIGSEKAVEPLLKLILEDGEYEKVKNRAFESLYKISRKLNIRVK
ncbi:MAG: HEAT repeat domain-containing protein [Thermoplasmata archaeon]|nr:MAG: HEAT repeat domain-containing protein [Thermoplasmata archaeon]